MDAGEFAFLAWISNPQVTSTKNRLGVLESQRFRVDWCGVAAEYCMI